jgi:hypothetical protein
MAPRLSPRAARELGRPLPDRSRLRQAAGLWAPLGVVALWAWGQAALLVGGLALALLPALGPLVLPPLPGLAGLPLLGRALAPAGGGALALLAFDVTLTIVAAGLVWGCLAGWWAARPEPFDTRLATAGEQAGG